MPRQLLMGQVAGLIAMFATTVNAQPASPDADLARAMEVQAKALKGWPGGVVFTCVITPADLASAPVKQICAQAAANASALAGQSKVKIAQAPDPQAFRQMVQRDRALGLTVQIGPSDFNAPVAVLVIRIFASRYYGDAVSASAKSAPNAPNPLAVARPGDVIFWEEALVGSGPPAQLAQGIAPAIDAKMRQFFVALTGTATR